MSGDKDSDCCYQASSAIQSAFIGAKDLEKESELRCFGWGRFGLARQLSIALPVASATRLGRLCATFSVCGASLAMLSLSVIGFP